MDLAAQCATPSKTPAPADLAIHVASRMMSMGLIPRRSALAPTKMRTGAIRIPLLREALETTSLAAIVIETEVQEAAAEAAEAAEAAAAAARASHSATPAHVALVIPADSPTMATPEMALLGNVVTMAARRFATPSATPAAADSGTHATLLTSLPPLAAVMTWPCDVMHTHTPFGRLCVPCPFVFCSSSYITP